MQHATHQSLSQVIREGTDRLLREPPSRLVGGQDGENHRQRNGRDVMLEDTKGVLKSMVQPRISNSLSPQVSLGCRSDFDQHLDSLTKVAILQSPIQKAAHPELSPLW